MQKFSWLLVAVLGLSTGFMTYKFILSGSAEKTDDGRIAIQLTSAERDLVLSEIEIWCCLRCVRFLIACNRLPRE